MSISPGIIGRPGASVPPDDLKRVLSLAQPDSNRNLPHIGIVGDTYTILLTGADTDGRFCLIDMHIPPGAVRLRTVTTSRKLSLCSRARLRPRFAARNP